MFGEMNSLMNQKTRFGMACFQYSFTGNGENQTNVTKENLTEAISTLSSLTELRAKSEEKLIKNCHMLMEKLGIFSNSVSSTLKISDRQFM